VKQLSPDPTPLKLQVFLACLLAFAILITPISAIAAPSIARATVATANKTKTNKSKSAAEELFVNPSLAPATEAAAALPGPKPEPAPEPFAPPVVGAVTATMTAALTATANNVDGKADPGDTINYTVQLGNTTAADATGLSFNPALDSHTTFVPGSIKSTPICFDQSVSTNEDIAKGITLTGQDPDGDTISFSIVTPPANGGFGVTTAPNLTYTPNADFFGSDSFTFRVNDGTTSGAGNNGNSNETCTVSITVNSVNDAPTFTVPGNPTAVNEDAGAQSVASFITGVRPAQSGNTTEDTQTVSFVITNNTNTGLFSSAPALNVVGASYPKTATLTYTSAANQNGTATITYHAHDNGGTANSGVDNSADQTFTITVNAVNDPPVVVAPAAFAAQANMKVTGLTGLLGNVNDNADNGVNGCVSTTFTVTSGSISATTPAGGIISNVNLSTGTFDFEPPPGATGDVTFTYTVSDTGCGSGTPGISSPVTVHVTVIGPVIWFVNPGAGPDTTHTGTLNNPFQLLASANTAMGVNAGQRIFVYTGTTTSGVGATLTTSQWFIGQGATDSSNTTNFDTLMGITPPANTIARPAVNGTRPTIQGRVQMNASNTRVQGIDITPPAGTQGLTGTSGAAMTGMQVGVSSAKSDVTVSTSGSSGTNAMAVSLNNAGGTFSFISVSSNGGQNGIGLTSTTGSFTVLGTGGTCTVATPTCTGGSIQSTTAAGINISATASVSLTRMKIQNSGGSGVSATSVNGFTFDNGIVTDSAGGAADEGILLTNASGTLTVSNSAISNAPHNGVHLNNFNTNATTFSLTNTTISCAAGQPCQPSGSIGNDGLLVEIRGTSVLPNGVVSGSTFSGVRAVGVQVQANDTGRIGVNNGAPTVFVPDATNSFVVQSNTFTGNGQGIDIDDAQVSNVTFQVLANTINGISTASGGNGSASAINAFTSAGNDTGPASHSFIGKIDGNFIGTQGTKDSGSGFGNGIRVVVQGNNTQGNITVSNNTVRECAIATPLSFIGQNGANTTATQNANTAHFKIINNTLPLPSGTNVDVCGTNTPCIDAGIFVLADELTPVCTTITGNNVFDATLMNGGADIYMAERAGPPAGAQLTVVGSGATTTFLNANNTLAGASKSVDEGGNTNTVASCGTFVSELRNQPNSNKEYLARTLKALPGHDTSLRLSFVDARNDNPSNVGLFNRTLLSAPAVATSDETLSSQFVAGVAGLRATSESRVLSSAFRLKGQQENQEPERDASARVADAQSDRALYGAQIVNASYGLDRVSSPHISKSVQRSEARDQRSDVRLNHAKSVKTEVRGQKSEDRSSRAAAHSVFAPMPFSGGTFPINGTGTGFTLPIGKTITIKYSVTLNNPPNLSGVPPATPQVSSQGTLSGAFIGNPIVTDDPGTIAVNDATVTLVDLFNTTTTLGAVPAAGSWNVGQSVTFTATVASNPAGNPTAVTGSVIFKDGATPIAGCNGVALSSAQAQCVTTFGSGAHSVTAVYSGDGNFDPSTSSALSQGAVNQSGTSTAVTSSLNPSLVTQNVTFTATVTSTSGFAGPPTGTVTFKDGVNPITCSNAGGQALNGSGVATCQIATLPAGSHSITAVYPGDTNFTTSTGTLTGDPQVVNKSNTSTVLGTSTNPVAPTVQVTYTATVSSSTSVTGPPTGTVTFKDGVTTIVCEAGSQALTAGVATCKFTYPDTVGSPHDITAVYGGDGTFNGNTSNHVSESVQACSASVVVTSNADSGANTLRDAINTGVCAGGTITFDPSVTSITLTTGELAISKNMTITGPGASTLTVSGGGASRVFNVAVGQTATISGMTITNGNVTGVNGSGGGGAAGANGADATGGGVSNAGTLTLTNVIVSNSHVTGGAGETGTTTGGAGGHAKGGGIFNSGTLTLTNSTVNGSNSATGGKGGDSAGAPGTGGNSYGGGIYSSGTLTLTGTTVDANSTTAGAGGATGGSGGTAAGGGIFIDSTATTDITRSTVSTNASANGAGIYALANGTINLTNSTISGNTATNGGGGINNVIGTINLKSCTITGNSAGGIGGGVVYQGGTINVANTIISGNTSVPMVGGGPDYFGALTSQGYNLIGNTDSTTITGTTTGNQLNVDPLLDVLADNGGPTKTHALKNLSPALEAGNLFGLTTDQRGFLRPVNSDGAAPVPPFDDSDIGAFEKQIAPNAPGAPDLDAVSDSGANSADDKTNVTTNLSFTISGVLSGATVQLFRDGTPVASGLASGASIQLTDPGPLTFTASGTTYSYTAKQSFGSDTSVASAALPVLITIIPDAPVLDPASDSGTLGDGITNDTSPTFNIANVVNTATVKLYRDGVEVASGTAAGTTIQLTDPSAPNGTFTYTAKQIFSAVTSDASAGASITITIKPNAPDLDATSDSGASNTDNYTNDATPTFTIAGAINGANVELLRDGTSVANGTAVGTSIQLTDPGASDGPHTYKARQTVGITLSPDSDGLDVTIDTSISQPSTPDLITADDSNINNDDVTSKTTPTFTGTADPNTVVQLFANGVLKGTGAADNSGAWSITSSALADGPYNMTAVATDAAGNVSIASGALPIVIDTTKPTVAMSSAVGNPTATTPIPVTVTFSEPVTGFTIGDIVPGNGTVGNFAGSGASYTFDLTPTGPGPVSADIAGGAAIDLAGNANTAATQFNRTFDPSALSVTITPVAPDPRNTSVSSIQIVFNKAVTGFDLPDLTLKLNGGANLLTGAQTLTSGDNITWTLGNLSGLTGTAGTYVLKLTASGSNIKDAANNSLTADATESWVTDTTAPDVTINQAAGQADPVTGPTASTVINFTAIFSEPVLAGSFTNSDVTISGTAGATVVNVTEIAPNDGTHFNVAIEGMTQSGTVIATIPAGRASDSAGNLNTVSTSTDNTVTFNKDDFTTLEVNTTLDADDGACTPIGTGNGCTLREAINAANADAGAETITFNPTVFAAPGPYTINLGSVLPDLSTDMTISGPGANVLTIKRNVAGAFRIFSVSNNATVSISGLTVTNGLTTEGGGIMVSPGALTLTRVAVTGNTANNTNGGGGIVVGGASTLNVIESTISGNHATVASGVGGGIFNNGGTLSIVNSTISGNDVTQGQGGGIFGTGGGSTTLSSSTITGNTAQTGGGIRVTGGHPATIKNTIVGGNTGTVAGPDMSNGGSTGTFSSAGFNLIKSTSDATITETQNLGTNITGVDPQLFALADNGGPTKTHALQCTSPAIDKGFNFTLATDQRGGVRPFDLADAIYPNAASPGNGTDIGAYETQTGGGCQPLAVPPSPQPSTNEDTQVTITLKGTYSQNFPLTFVITQQPGHAISNLVPTGTTCTFTTFTECTATVSYTPTLNFNGLDSFKFKASAGGLDSDEADVNITVIPVNDPPIANPQSVVTNEDTPVGITLTGSDVDSASLSFIIVTPPAHGSFGATTAPNLTYTPTANYNGPDSFTFKINDGSADSNIATVSITVNAVNDAPVMDNTGNMSLGAISEDVPVASNTGTLVTAVIASAGGTRITDVDAGALTGLAVIAVDNANGTWQFSIDNGVNWFAFGAPDSLNARLLAADANTRVRFLPNANFNGTVDPGLTFRAWDRTAGTNGNTADTSVVGGTTAFSTATETASITVNPVNDAPTADSQSTSTNEDTPLPITLTGSDLETASGSLIFAISVAPSHGTISSGTGAARTYTPAANYNGPDSFKFTVTDTGDGSSAALTSTEATVTITVNAVNDAPTFTRGPDQSANGAVAQTVNNWATSISAGPPDESGQTVTFLVSNDNNALFSVQPAISPTGTLTYTPAYGFDGTATVTVRLRDNGGTALGGVDTSAPQTFTITVHALNNAPTLNALGNVVINEDAALQTVNLAGITAGPSFESGQTLTVTATSSNPVLIPNPTVSYTSPNTTGSISFTPLPDANGSVLITVTVKDNGGTLNGGVDTFVRTFTVTVNPVNDAPVNHVPGAQTGTLNTNLVFSTATANLIFISDVDAGSDPVQVTLKATDGTLTLNGTSGLSFITGDGADDQLMTFTGTIANINLALNGMRNLTFGTGVIEITTNDLGHNGAGGPLSDTDTIAVTVNDSLAPVLLTADGTDRAIALDSVTLIRDPFTELDDHNFSADHHTRVALFALHAQLQPGETQSAITAEAQDLGGNIFALTVESVRTVPGFDWLTQVVVRLPDVSQGGGGSQDIKVRIRLRGQSSNQAVITIVPSP
jgi:CSLREA domain-containing protein